MIRYLGPVTPIDIDCVAESLFPTADRTPEIA